MMQSHGCMLAISALALGPALVLGMPARGIVKANKYRRFSASNPAERVVNS